MKIGACGICVRMNPILVCPSNRSMTWILRIEVSWLWVVVHITLVSSYLFYLIIFWFSFHQHIHNIIVISFNEQLVQERVRAAFHSTPPQAAVWSLTGVQCQAFVPSDRWASVQWWWTITRRRSVRTLMSVTVCILRS